MTRKCSPDKVRSSLKVEGSSACMMTAWGLTMTQDDVLTLLAEGWLWMFCDLRLNLNIGNGYGIGFRR